MFNYMTSYFVGYSMYARLPACYHQPSYNHVYVQIEDCRTRYNGDADHHQRRKKFSFPARLICGDCYEVIFQFQ